MNSIKTERFLVYRPIGRFFDVKVLSSTLHFSWFCTEGWKRGKMSRGRAAFDLPSFFCTYQPNKTYCVSVLYKNSDISYPKFVFDVIYTLYTSINFFIEDIGHMYRICTWKKRFWLKEKTCIQRIQPQIYIESVRKC